MKKKIKILVIVLCIILLLIGIGGGILLEKFILSDNKDNITTNKDNITTQEKEDSNSNLQVSGDILKILGIDSSNNSFCLNHYITEYDLQEKKEEVFSYYASENSLESSGILSNCFEEGICTYDNNLSPGAAASRTILVTDANKIIEAYNLKNMNSFLLELPGKYNNYYSFLTTNASARMCDSIANNIDTDYTAEHSFTDVIYGDDESIVITDLQKIKMTERIVNGDSVQVEDVNSEQNVKYTLKKNDNGNYYLANVEIIK